ncbi:PP2C family serine/threonine-protein phosphatase, partial [Nocardia sp. 2YAB30]|uniref:PP2C family protein-serine/threonine phosphatase n=1 Tax=Nocardia sp. 2YAB30 TaxID=3233022 RepID=UPI003F993941
MQVLAAEFSNGIPEIPLRPHGPNNIPEKLEKIQLFGNPRNWAEQGNKARLFRAGMANLTALHQARTELESATQAVRDLAGREGLHPRRQGPGFRELQARRVAQQVWRKLRTAENEVEEFFDLLAADVPGGLSAQQRHVVRRFGVLAAEWNNQNAQVQEHGEDSDTPVAYAARNRRRWAAAKMQLAATQLALDPVLRPVAEFDGGWLSETIPLRILNSAAEAPDLKIHGLDGQTPADRVEIDETTVVAVSDRGALPIRSTDGISHEKPTNEDAVAAVVVRTPQGPVRIAVVCDGVSLSNKPHLAARDAVAAARKHLEEFARGLRPGQRLSQADAEAAMKGAIEAARAAVAALGGQPGDFGVPATPIVAIMAQPGRDGQPGRYVTGWVGDSRAELLRQNGRNQIERLTEDHSGKHPGELHHLLDGHHRLPKDLNNVVSGELLEDDVLVIHSDGWNSARPDAIDFEREGPSDTTLLFERAKAGDLHAVRDMLLERAILDGGHDNITIAVISGSAAEPLPRVLPHPAGVVPEGARVEYRLLATEYAEARDRLRRLAGLLTPSGMNGENAVYPSALMNPDFARELRRMRIYAGRNGESEIATHLDAATHGFHRLGEKIREFQSWFESKRAEAWTEADADYLAALTEWSMFNRLLVEAGVAESAEDAVAERFRTAEIGLTRAHLNLPDVRAEQRLDESRTVDGLEIPVGLRRVYRAWRAEVRVAARQVAERLEALPPEIIAALTDDYRQLYEDLIGSDYEQALEILTNFLAAQDESPTVSPRWRNEVED